MRKVQNSFLKGLMPLIQLTNTFLQLPDSVSRESRESFVKQGLDALILIAQAKGELNQRRREMIKPDLNQHYQQLCNYQVPITSWLFGYELAKTCQDITNTNRGSQKSLGLSHTDAIVSRNNVDITTTQKVATRGLLRAVIEKRSRKVSALNMLTTRAEKYFKAAQINHLKDAWEKLTSDSWILGVNIEFTELPNQHYTPTRTEAKRVDYKINKIFETGVIIDCYQEDGEFI